MNVYIVIILVCLINTKSADGQQGDYVDNDAQPVDYYADYDTEYGDEYTHVDTQPEYYYFDEDALPFHETHIVSDWYICYIVDAILHGLLYRIV